MSPDFGYKIFDGHRYYKVDGCSRKDVAERLANDYRRTGNYFVRMHKIRMPYMSAGDRLYQTIWEVYVREKPKWGRGR